MIKKLSALSKFQVKKIQVDIANWSSREPYETIATIEKKINSRISRKYKIRIESKDISGKIKHYRQIYKLIKKNLPKYICPSTSGYADTKYVKNKEIKQFLIKKFPTEETKILDMIISWVVYYEYLS